MRAYATRLKSTFEIPILISSTILGMDHKDAAAIGQIIAQAPSRASRSQRLFVPQAERKTGLDRRYLSRIEAGEVNPTVIQAIRIADALRRDLRRSREPGTAGMDDAKEAKSLAGIYVLIFIRFSRFYITLFFD